LYVLIHVTPHPIFSRKDENIHLTLPITFAEAALGADISIPTLEGDEVVVRIAPGTPSGRTLRVKGRGVKKGSSSGDLMITLDVAIPQRVDGSAKKAIEDFANATKEFNPRLDFVKKAKL
jgi:molecular chaperone DnaJ